MADRGAHRRMIFEKCERGYVLRANEHSGAFGEVYAFDTIALLAKWMVEQYAPPPQPETDIPTACYHFFKPE